MASWGRSSSVYREVDPRRSIPVLATNTPAWGRLGAQEGSRAWVSGPVLSRTRKWTQPQERRKARMAGGEGEARVELEEELTEVLKGRKLGLQLVEQRLLPPLERRRHGPRAQRHNNDGGGEHGQPSQPEQQHQDVIQQVSGAVLCHRGACVSIKYSKVSPLCQLSSQLGHAGVGVLHLRPPALHASHSVVHSRLRPPL
ncbi:hypothetical protein INR49_031273 [Caranx melampygus]|nr:hypothetical protein INR49_031273 [Caranx melampygus]